MRSKMEQYRLLPYLKNKKTRYVPINNGKYYTPIFFFDRMMYLIRIKPILLVINFDGIYGQ